MERERYCTLFRAHTLRQHEPEHTAFVVVVVFVVISHRNLSVPCHQHPAVSFPATRRAACTRVWHKLPRACYVCMRVCMCMCVCVCARARVRR